MASTPAPSATGTLAFGVASALANVFGYLVTVLLVRGLAPAEFGAIGALFALGIVGTMPSTALQLALAQRTAKALEAGEPPVTRQTAVKQGLVLGAAMTAAFAVLSVPLAHYLHLDSALLVVVVGVTLVPMLVTAGLQGLMLGCRRFWPLSASTFVSGVTRLVAIPVGLSLGDVSAVLCSVVGAATVTAVVTFLMTQGGPGQRLTLRPLLQRTSQGTVTLTAYFLLTNLDIPVARHVLDSGDSGTYVLGSMFAKICLWGPQFLSVVAFPSMHDAQHGRRATLRVSALTFAVGGLASLTLLPLGGRILSAVSGDAHDPRLDGLAAWFGLLGSVWAVLHALVLHEVATRRARDSWWLWLGAAALGFGVSLLPVSFTVDRVLVAAILVSSLVVLVGLWRVLRDPPRDSGVLGDPVTATAEELLTDRHQNF